MGRGIVYLLTGHRQAVRLVASAWSLRRHYDGPVTVLSMDPAREIDRYIAGDRRLRLNFVGIDQPGIARRRNGSYATKTLMQRWTPYDSTLYLDADTIVSAPLPDMLWPHDDELVLTRFSDWVSSGPRMRSRIRRWSGVFPEEVKAQLASRVPAINTGVFAWPRSRTEDLDVWHRMTMKRVSFMCDELAMQLHHTSVPHRVLDDRCNQSVLYGTLRSRGEDAVVVWHFHGSKHLIPQAGDRWTREFREIVREDVAGVAGWAPAGDKRLRQWMATQ